MKRQAQNRGSVLLMAVGLLTIIALLGATFLVVSHTDAQQAQAMAIRHQAEPLASSALGAVQSLLAQDLHIVVPGGKVPYEAGGGEHGWSQYIDHGSGYVDNWLSMVIDDGSGTTSRRLGDFTMLYNAVPGSPDLDIDGDGRADAKLYETGMRSSLDEEYLVAIKVEDLSAKININTAGRTDPSVLISNPALVNLQRYIGTAAVGVPTNLTLAQLEEKGKDVYEMLHLLRSGQKELTLDIYSAECGRRVLSPVQYATPGPADPLYLPLCIGEQVQILHKSSYIPPPLARLSSWIYPVMIHPSLSPAERANMAAGDWYRQFTTYNCSRILLRHADAADPRPQVVLHDPAAGFDLTSDTHRQEAYKAVLAWLKGAALLPDRPNISITGVPTDDHGLAKRLAAHFVANAWEAVAPSDTDKIHAFRPNDPLSGMPENFRVFGLKQDLVITEVVARHKMSTPPANVGDPPTDDYAVGCAIEIWNPTAVSIDLGDYKLVREDGTTEFALSGTLASKGRLTVYRFERGANNSFTDYTFLNGGKAIPGSTLDAGTFLNFNGGGKSVRLVRVVEYDGTPGQLVIDSFSSDVLGYSVLNPSDPEDNETVVARRDDAETTWRCNGAAYSVYLYPLLTDPPDMTPPPTPADDPDTDLPNRVSLGAARTALGDDQPLAPVLTSSLEIVAFGGSKPRDFSDLARIYFAGHVQDPEWLGSGTLDPNDIGSQRPFSEGILTRGFKDTAVDPTTLQLFADPLRGRLDFHEKAVYATAVSLYPDVPSACLLNEFITLAQPDMERKIKFDPSAVLNHALRTYGRINVNTATREVLRALPWPDKVGGSPLSSRELDDIIEYVMAYRDARQTQNLNVLPGRVYTLRSDPTGADITNLRVYPKQVPPDPEPEKKGFLTPGEVAIPLIDALDDLIGGFTDDEKQTNAYVHGRLSLYKPISNLVTVNSDTFAVHIMVQLQAHDDRSNSNFEYDTPYHPFSNRNGYRNRWHFLAVIDRGNCVADGDLPQVIMFAELK